MSRNDASKWLADIFSEALGRGISASTIRKKDYRARKEVGTNVPKQSKVIENTPEIIKDRHPQGGGKRNGAGRKFSQKTIWRKVEKKLISLTEYMKENCETPADIEDSVKKEIERHIGLLNIYIDQL